MHAIPTFDPRRPASALGCATLLALAPGWALAQPAATIAFDIKPGSLDSALIAYAAQSGFQILYDADTVAGLRSPGLSGRHTAEAALPRLLGDAPLAISRAGPRVFVIKPRGAADLIRDQEVEAVVVTGSHIRGGADGPAPVVVIDRSQIDRSGQATVAEAIGALPQAFGGSSTPATAMTFSDTRNTNSALATGVNLRGLGSDATLVLINGRRMAGTGLKGDFADLSTLPTAAVDRVEVLLDGASAVYGSDAVGGVVNVILRQDFDGGETRLRLGAAQGGAESIQVGQTLGAVWGGGHILAAYEYERRNALAYADRSYTATADLRPFGGTDRRVPYSHPGNILAFDPATSSYRPRWAIPKGQNGTGLTPSDFILGGVNLDNPNKGMDLLPAQTRHSLYLNFGQDLGERVHFSADARIGRRISRYAGAPPIDALVVTSANPFFVSPDGAASHIIGYSFADELGSPGGRSTSSNIGLSAGAAIDLGARWRLDAYGAYAADQTKLVSSGAINSAHLLEALGTTPDDPRTAYSPARDGYFNPYGDEGANSAAVLDFIGAGYTRVKGLSQVSSFNVTADGPLLALPGGDLKLAAGAQVRQESYHQKTVGFRSRPVPTVRESPHYVRTITAGFLELRAPLLGPDNQVPGVRRLELSAAARIERYDDVGTTTNPKVGVVWEPIEGLRLRTTYGTAFRAPALPEVYETASISPTFLPKAGAQVLSLIRFGGNTDLEPETATTWTAGFDLTPPQLPGLRLGVTWFRTAFEDRIGQPALLNLAQALSSPELASFVQQINPANPADLARVQALLNDPTYTGGGLYGPGAFGAIVDARYVNTARQTVSGLDLTTNYGFTRDQDRFDLSLNATWLLRFDRQVTPLAPVTDQLDLAGYPVDLRARATGAWSRGPLGASLSLNYVDDYRDGFGGRVGSWTTADIQIRWTSQDERGPLRGLSAAFTVQNLFDAAPPFYDSFQGVGFDPTNADALGRVASLQLTRRW